MGIYAFADEAHPEIDLQIEAMQRNHLNGVEIRDVEGTNISKISLEKAREVRSKLDAAGLVTWSLGSPLGKIDIEEGDWEEHKETFKHCLEIADILGTKNIRLFSFKIPKEKDPYEYRNEVIDRMGWFADHAKGTDIRLCHENEKRIYGDTAIRCKEVLDAVPSLYAVFDPANFVQCEEDTLAAWELLKDRVAYMHIKDALKNGIVVPAGCGDGNVKAIVKDYIARGGRDFTIEPHLHSFGTFKELEAGVDKKSIIGQEYVFETNDEAFDAANAYFKEILQSL